MSRRWVIAQAVLRRVLVFVATALGAAVLAQVLLATAPGDAIDTLPNADELRPYLAAEWGLDRPLPARVATAAIRALSLDLGESLTTRPGAPVLDLALEQGGRSLPRVAAAALVAVLAAFLLSQHGRVRRALSLLSALPAVIMALVLVHGLNALCWAAIAAGGFARPAWFALPAEDHPVRTGVALLVLALSSNNLAHLASSARADVDRLLAAPFVEAERARGGALLLLLARHLVVPVSRLAASQVAALLGSLVVVEHGLGLGGAGALFYQACRLRDWPLAAGLAALAGVAVASASLLADLLELAVDPRSRGSR